MDTVVYFASTNLLDSNLSFEWLSTQPSFDIPYSRRSCCAICNYMMIHLRGAGILANTKLIITATDSGF